MNLIILSVILKYVVDPMLVGRLLGQLPEEAKPLPPEKFHVTLLHQLWGAELRRAIISQLCNEEGLSDDGELPSPKGDVMLWPNYDGLCVAFNGRQSALPKPPPLLLGERVFKVERPHLKRASWIVLCQQQEDFRHYVNKVLLQFGLSPDPEPRRVYHVSLANLKGDPFMSVGDVSVSDLA